MGCCALPLGSLDSLFGIPGWRLGGISAIVYQLFTFSLLQLHPLWIDYVQSRHKKRLRVTVYSAPIVVVKEKTFLQGGSGKQQKSLNSNEEGENSSLYHSASVRETGAHGPYFFLQQSKHQLQSEARDISDFVSDPVILTFIHDFAKARFVPEISRFLYAAYQYRQMADTVPDEEQPGSPAAEPTNKSLVWDLGLREAYLGMVAEFFAPDSPYEVNVEAGVLRRAAALAPAGAWQAASDARRAAVFIGALRAELWARVPRGAGAVLPAVGSGGGGGEELLGRVPGRGGAARAEGVAPAQCPAVDGDAAAAGRGRCGREKKGLQLFFRRGRAVEVSWDPGFQVPRPSLGLDESQKESAFFHCSSGSVYLKLYSLICPH
eukprot:CAMPEP_0206400268 /NCGR_PEP_ID=MMETSP0294-20121207/25417_1 /ASSEMBLY_ACC=CAM_ASM_000327 /TAXON_ID=39354 /ORGANISM="Heterosigma akashiwo, Strain CCMP2393" /LENGTH=376 /DNA_ID=CAMNT_0053856433 /DNA_START=421 /DNA_END=1548 /DNA_ORIENTATION=+